MKSLQFQETDERSHRQSQGRLLYAHALWTIGCFGTEIPMRGAFELFGLHCQAIGFPKLEQKPDIAEGEALTRRWMEHIEASTRQKPGEDTAGRDLIPTNNSRRALDRNRWQMRTKGPVIEIIVWLVF